MQIIHNASIMNAVGACGLQLYRFGEAISIPFFTDTWRPDSFYDKIKANRLLGLHTLCLLGNLFVQPDVLRYMRVNSFQADAGLNLACFETDIRVKEPTLESLCRYILAFLLHQQR